MIDYSIDNFMSPMSTVSSLGAVRKAFPPLALTVLLWVFSELFLTSASEESVSEVSSQGEGDEVALLQTFSQVEPLDSSGDLGNGDNFRAFCAELLQEAAAAAALAPVLLAASRARSRGATKKPRPAPRPIPASHDGPAKEQQQPRSRGAVPPQEKAHYMLLSRQVVSAAKHGDLAQAERLAAEVRAARVPLSVIAYGTMVSACAKAGNAARAEWWLAELIASGVGKPNVISFNIVINACAKANALDRAERWLQRMSELGTRPDTLSFNSLIDACARVGDVSRAELWLARMRESETPPNIISYNSVLHACANGSDGTAAEKVFNQMLSDSVAPDVVSYSTLIQACARSGNFDGAMTWLDHMAEKGVEPDAVIYNSVIKVCARAGGDQRAEAWIAKMEESGRRAKLHAGRSFARAPGMHASGTGAPCADRAGCRLRGAERARLHR